MPTFQFNARDTAGKWHKGSQAAESSAELAGALRAKGLSLVSAEQATKKEEAAQSRSQRGWGILPPTSLDVELGLLMLANMLDGGLTLMSALKTCADQSRRVRMAKIWDDIHDQVAGGKSFYRRPHTPQGSLSTTGDQRLAQAGEATGNLEIVLQQAADQLERKRNLLITVVSGHALSNGHFGGRNRRRVVSGAEDHFGNLGVSPESGKKTTGHDPGGLIATSDFIRDYGLTISICPPAPIVAGLIIAHRWLRCRSGNRWCAAAHPHRRKKSSGLQAQRCFPVVWECCWGQACR